MYIRLVVQWTLVRVLLPLAHMQWALVRVSHPLAHVQWTLVSVTPTRPCTCVVGKWGIPTCIFHFLQYQV